MYSANLGMSGAPASHTKGPLRRLRPEAVKVITGGKSPPIRGTGLATHSRQNADSQIERERDREKDREREREREREGGREKEREPEAERGRER